MELFEYLKEKKEIALAFSGGVDSAYLLYACLKSCKKVTAYYVKTAFQPEFEFEDAKRLAKELNADMKVITLDVLKDEKVTENPPDRCYYCKNNIFNAILLNAHEDGYTYVADGTNASDDASDRPGMRALKELKVISPLRECGLDKTTIRRLSKEAGLFTHDKPAYACLATRIKTGETITEEKLKATEYAENFLFGLGFKDFRVRLDAGRAIIQVHKEQLQLVIDKRDEINEALKGYYKSITLDLEVRK